MNRIILFCFLALALDAAALTGQAPTATASRRAGDVSIDGRVDESAWAAATPVTSFTQREPKEGTPPSERTEIRILYDDAAIYIAARMFDRIGVTTRLVRRDADPTSDLLRINFDTYHDKLHNVEFTVNPDGVRGDRLDGDASWDPVWEAAASQDSLGWSAELRIPLSQLHFSRQAEQTWGMQITRIINRLNETDLWAFVPLNQSMQPAYYGTLTGMRLAHQPSHLELLPYVSVRAERLNSEDAASPFYDPNTAELRVGGDVRYPITPSLTLAATVNPDFGQVEVDPAVVNLSAFETFFSEKRPFFIEGASLFDFGSPGCMMNCGFGLFPFYSRRVGRTPQATMLAFQRGDFVDAPANTDIIAAAKVTGRTRHGTSVGVMNALVAAQHARVALPAGGTERVQIEPLTNDFIARVKHEMLGGNLSVGGIATSVDRDLDTDAMRALLPRSGRTLGADVELFWGDHRYHAYAALLGTDVRGDSLAILRLQQSSARIFQRPDRDLHDNGLFTGGFDPGLTSLRGYGAITRINKTGGAWQWDLNAASISPGFETNDLGFLQTADWRWVNASLLRQWTKPTSLYRQVLGIIGLQSQWNYDGDRTLGELASYWSVTFPNYWTASLYASTAANPIDERLTRGGPAVLRPGNKQYFDATFSTDPRRRLQASVSGTRILDVEGGFYNAVDLTLTARPASNLSISASPSFSRGLTTDQYVTTIDDPTATAFFGKRYVFAHLIQNTASMSIRGNATFSPTLSLEVYVQPLIVSGDYSKFEEFAAPRGMEKLIYGRDVGAITPIGGGYRIDPDASGPATSFDIGDPNFNFRSLRGTAVLRWEWRPGSTIFLAWTQERAGIAAVGDFDFARDREAIFAAQPDNILVLKATYWLSR